MKVVCDYVLVKIDDEFNRHLGVIRDENGNEHQLVINTNWRPEHHVKITAEVIAVPEYLSGKDSPYYERYAGMPRPTPYRGHDQLMVQFSMLPKKYQHRKDKVANYSCGSYTPEMVTSFGIPVEVQVGDKIYFHYSILLTEEHYLWRDEDGRMVYRVPYTSIFCGVRDHKIYMVNANVLVDEINEGADEFDVNGILVRGKIKNNLVVELGEKPKYLTGIIRHIGGPVGDDTRLTCKPGETVIFRPSSEFKNTIEGHEYYVMKQWDLVNKVMQMDREIDEKLSMYAHVEVNTLLPVGDYLLVEPEEVEFMPQIKKHIYDPNKPVQDFKPGELFILKTVYNLDKKATGAPKFGIGHVIMEGENSSGKQGKRIAYAKSSYYLYLKEYKKVMIRAGDVLGEFTQDIQVAMGG